MHIFRAQRLNLTVSEALRTILRTVMMPAMDRLRFVPALALFGFTALCGVGCSDTSLSQQRSLTPPISAVARVNNTEGERLGATRIVTSSWYGPGYKGKRTSSGELFDPNRFTAASRT